MTGAELIRLIKAHNLENAELDLSYPDGVNLTFTFTLSEARSGTDEDDCCYVDYILDLCNGTGTFRVLGNVDGKKFDFAHELNTFGE